MSVLPDYGNAETDNDDDGKGANNTKTLIVKIFAGTMEAVYLGTAAGWGHGQGKGPWVMADLEKCVQTHAALSTFLSLLSPLSVSLCTRSYSLSLCIILVVMMRSKELKISRFVLSLILSMILSLSLLFFSLLPLSLCTRTR